MENPKEEKQKERLRCSKCGSGFGYLRFKDRIWRCRSCGSKEVMT